MKQTKKSDINADTGQWDTNTVSFYTLDGEEIAVYKRPKDGSRYVSNNKPRGFMSRYEPKKSPKS